MITSLLRWLLLLAVPHAHAQPWQEACSTLPGGCPPQNVLLLLVPVAGSIMVGIAGGGAVLFTIIGGAQMVLSMGDDGAGAKGKTTILYAIGGFMLALASQTIVNFVHSRAVLSGLITAATPHLDLMQTIVGGILSLMNIGFVMICLYAGFRMVLAWGKQDEFHKAFGMILWAIIGALCVNAASALTHAVLRIGL